MLPYGTRLGSGGDCDTVAERGDVHGAVTPGGEGGGVSRHVRVVAARGADGLARAIAGQATMAAPRTASNLLTRFESPTTRSLHVSRACASIARQTSLYTVTPVYVRSSD